MTNEKLVGLFGTISHLRDLHRQQEKTMRDMVFAVARAHLKQNEVKQTYDDWQYTRAALEMLLGKEHFIPNVGGFAMRKAWPTHLRVRDLAPVRVQSAGNLFHAYPMVKEGSIVCEILSQESLDLEYLPLTNAEIK